jgi:hypothetical protein
MDLNSIQQFVRINNIQGKLSYEAKTTASVSFAATLNTVVSREMINAVQANENPNNVQFRKKKDIVEDGDNMVPEDEENESIYKTVKKIEKRLIALSRLERQMMAGF